MMLKVSNCSVQLNMYKKLFTKQKSVEVKAFALSQVFLEPAKHWLD